MSKAGTLYSRPMVSHVSPSVTLWRMTDPFGQRIFPYAQRPHGRKSGHTPHRFGGGGNGLGSGRHAWWIETAATMPRNSNDTQAADATDEHRHDPQPFRCCRSHGLSDWSTSSSDCFTSPMPGSEVLAAEASDRDFGMERESQTSYVADKPRVGAYIVIVIVPPHTATHHSDPGGVAPGAPCRPGAGACARGDHTRVR